MFSRHPVEAKRPRILITGPDSGGAPARLATSAQVFAAGGTPVYSCPSAPQLDLNFSGVILGGGADVNPELYGGSLASGDQAGGLQEGDGDKKLLRKVFKNLSSQVFNFTSSRGALDFSRDKLEYQILDVCAEKKVPVLGICRGLQLMNVYFGGSLKKVQVDSEIPHPRTIRPQVKILIEPESRLKAIVEKPEILVNSLHDQEIDSVGKGLDVVGLNAQGRPRAIECKDENCHWIGVQWHPELIPQLEAHRALFQWLVTESKN